MPLPYQPSRLDQAMGRTMSPVDQRLQAARAPLAAPKPTAPTPAPLSATPQAATPTSAAPSSLPSIPGVNLTPANPANDLRSQTITPGATADRYQIAQDRFGTFAKATDPYYAKSLRDATSQAAGAGRLGSGMLRTGLGDLANTRNLQLDNARDTFLTSALEGSIDDAYRNVGIAQQQQGFQSGLQNQTFQQQLQALGLGDQLTNSAFNRNATLYNIGSQGNPTATQLALAQLTGQNASNASNALGGLISGTTANNSQQTVQDLLRQLGIGTYSPSVTGGSSAIPDTAFGL